MFGKVEQKTVAFFHAIKKELFNSSEKTEPLCHLEEIDLSLMRVSVKNRWSIYPLTYPLAEVICDTTILANLPPCQASFIGYYYGLSYRTTSFTNRIQHHGYSNFNFPLGETRSRYKLLYHHRDGDVAFADKSVGIEIRKAPLNVIKNPSLIDEFDPLEACYIGILAGVAAYKKLNI